MNAEAEKGGQAPREARAVLRFVRMAPRKGRLVVDLIRGRRASDALSLLNFTQQRAARTIRKVLRSAIANAEQKELGDVDDLFVKHAVVDGGPVMKRFKAAPMGRARPIKHRLSHVTIVVTAQPRLSRPTRKAVPTAPSPRPSPGKPPEAEKGG